MASNEQIRDFLNLIAPLIQKEAKLRKYRICSTVIAQAAVESAWGLSELAKYHNYFGLKCGSKWAGNSVNMKTKEEYIPGQLSTVRDNFRAYDCMVDGVKGYYDFISSPRYFNLKIASTPKQYAEYLKADGYATSSTYVNTLVNTVNKCNLTVYDKELSGNEDPNRNPYDEPTKNVKLNTRGNDAKWCQYALNKKGAHLIVDGIFGVKSVDALKQFQFSHGLVSDGICGEKTRAALKK